MSDRALQYPGSVFRKLEVCINIFCIPSKKICCDKVDVFAFCKLAVSFSTVSSVCDDSFLLC